MTSAVIFFAALVQAAAAAQAVHPKIWPKLSSPPRSARIEREVSTLLAKMMVEEKVGQVIQASIITVTPDDVRTYHLGSILNGGGGWPGDVRKASPRDWLAKADAFYDASMDTSNGRLAIPIIWGADAVHGHNNIVGATLFPHNIGLGATRDAELVRKIGEITADEVATTGIDWNFFPTVAVVRDVRWGRTYESYSEDPALVARLGVAFIRGLQSHHILATAKHYLGDGGTDGGKDQGDNLSTEEQLRDVHGAGYFAAIPAGVETVMASFNSWHGEKMHGNQALLTDVLKKRMGFDGIVVGDWNGHAQVPGCTNASCPHAFNAGIDMFMVPDDWKALYNNTLAQVRSGEIPMARLDDAVRRILRVKFRAGLFAEGRPSQRPLGGKFEQLGSAGHRSVARRAVRESLVLLKNNGHTLPLSRKLRVLVAGDGADSIAKQTGGWTLTWQGDGNSNADFPGATSVWDGIRKAVEAAGGTATLSADGSFTEKPQVAIVVYGENPYAEFRGDRRTYAYSDAQHLALLRKLKSSGVPVVSVFLSGRPLWVNPFLNASDAFVAAWLPGTEAGGIADVLFGANNFHGKLSFSWPASPSENPRMKAQFHRGYGLTYAKHTDLQTLPEPHVDVEAARDAYFVSGNDVPPWTMSATGATMAPEGQESRTITWPAAGGELAIRSHDAIDLTRESNAGLALSLDVMLRKAPTGRVTLDGVDITSLVSRLPLDQWSTIRVRLRCLGLAQTNAPLVLASTGELALTISDVKLVPGSDEPCPQ